MSFRNVGIFEMSVIQETILFAAFFQFSISNNSAHVRPVNTLKVCLRNWYKPWKSVSSCSSSAVVWVNLQNYSTACRQPATTCGCLWCGCEWTAQLLLGILNMPWHVSEEQTYLSWVDGPTVGLPFTIFLYDIQYLVLFSIFSSMRMCVCNQKCARDLFQFHRIDSKVVSLPPFPFSELIRFLE